MSNGEYPTNLQRLTLNRSLHRFTLIEIYWRKKIYFSKCLFVCEVCVSFKPPMSFSPPLFFNPSYFMAQTKCHFLDGLLYRAYKCYPHFILYHPVGGVWETEKSRQTDVGHGVVVVGGRGYRMTAARCKFILLWTWTQTRGRLKVSYFTTHFINNNNSRVI